VAGAAAVQAQPASDHATGTKVSTAKATVGVHASRFGFGPGQALIAKNVYSDKTGSSIRFDRTYRGLPVIGGDFVVRLSPTGAFQYGNGRKVVGLPNSVRPAISKAAASHSAAAALNYKVTQSTAKLVIFTTARSSSLAWQVTTGGQSGLHADISYISARTGAKLASWTTVETSSDNGTGKTLWVGKVKLKDDKQGKKYNLTDLTRGKQDILDANNSGSRVSARSSPTRTTCGATARPRAASRLQRTRPMVSQRHGTSIWTPSTARALPMTARPPAGSCTSAPATATPSGVTAASAWSSATAPATGARWSRSTWPVTRCLTASPAVPLV